MAEIAPRDANNVPALLAVLNSDGSTVKQVLANASTHALKINDANTGSDDGPVAAERDENYVPTLVAVSSTTTTVNGVHYVQGVTPVVVYADSSGNLMVDSS